MNNLDVELRDLAPLQKKSLTAGVIAIALCLVGAYFDRHQFFQSYLMAYLFWIGIPVGCFGIVMIHHLVGGTWGFVIQRPLESAIRTLPVMALLFIPIFFGMSDLYSWARPDVVAQDKVLQQKSLYLNVPFFSLRTILYFAIWISVGYFLTKWSREQDHNADGSLCRSAAASQRSRTCSIRIDGNVLRYRLVDVTGTAMVLVDLRNDIHG